MDDGSRGFKADAITPNCRWLNGPAFLVLSEDQWPEDISKSKFTTDMTCETPAEINMSAAVARKLSSEHMDLSHYSSFVKVYELLLMCNDSFGIAEEERQIWKRRLVHWRFKKLRRHN